MNILKEKVILMVKYLLPQAAFLATLKGRVSSRTNPSQPPEVPEVCYPGGEENSTFSIPGPPVRHLIGSEDIHKDYVRGNARTQTEGGPDSAISGRLPDIFSDSGRSRHRPANDQALPHPCGMKNKLRKI